MQEFHKFKWRYIPLMLCNMIAYNFIEFLLLCGLIVDGWGNDPFTSWVLWMASAVMAFWIVVTTVGDADATAKEFIMERHIFLFDFAGAAIILFLISVVLWDEPWYFKTIFLLGTVQNVRLSYLSIKWLNEERHNTDSTP